MSSARIASRETFADAVTKALSRSTPSSQVVVSHCAQRLGAVLGRRQAMNTLEEPREVRRVDQAPTSRNRTDRQLRALGIREIPSTVLYPSSPDPTRHGFAFAFK